MFNKLRRKMLWFYMLTISSVMLAAFVTIYVITNIYIQNDIDQRIYHVSRSWNSWAQTMYRDEESPEERETRQNLFLDIGNPFVLTLTPRWQEGDDRVVDDQGKVACDVKIKFYYDDNDNDVEYEDYEYREAAAQAWIQEKGTVTLGERKWKFGLYPGEQRSIVKLWGPSPDPDSEEYWYYNVVFVDITDSNTILVRLFATFIIVGALMLIILFVICSIFARRSIRPLEESWNKQKQFVTDASHELKTPIAIVTSNLDAIEASGDETVESQQEWFGYIRAELKRLSTLISDLLYLAKSGDIMQQENRLPFDFGATVETAVTSMEAMIYEKGISLDTRVEEGVFVAGDEAKLKQAVLVLLDNAAKYTPEKGKIMIILTEDKGEAVFQVQNTGDGISREDLPKIFDRFYRPDSSRSHETGGYGLGLSIAKAIVERAGGAISAQSDAKVTMFRIGLKLYK
ncbi:MAG: HAMP domain-containing histidine kinase [Peptococcaceae bacterium]|nr:HAMP domain-containing histidine kinase [Peptococcaceae bacterium]